MMFTSRERKRAVGSIGNICVAETAPFDKLMAKGGHGTHHVTADRVLSYIKGADMAILVICLNPACGEIFDVPDDAGGTMVTCSACGSQQTAGAAPKVKAPAKKAPEKSSPPASAAGDVRPSAPAGEAELSLTPEPASLDLAEDAPPPAPKPLTKPPAGPVTPQRQKDDAAKAATPASPAEGDIDFGAPEDEKPRHRPAPQPVVPFSPSQQESQEPLGVEELTSLDDIEVPKEFQKQADQGVLEHKKAPRIILAIGTGGLMLGALLGMALFDNPIAGLYAGGGAGWAIGFAAAFMFVLAAERGEISRVRCPLCNNIFPAETESCTWCGVAAPPLVPLTAEYTDSIHYARTTPWAIAWLTLLVMVATLVLSAVYELLLPANGLAGKIGDFWVLLVALCVLVGFVVFSQVVRFWTSASADTLLRRRDRAPNAPEFFSGDTYAMGVKCLAGLVLYVMPVVTLPLLPLGFLGLSACRKGALSVPASIRIIKTYSRDVVVLWLMLLLWCGGLALSLSLATAVAWTILQFMPTDYEVYVNSVYRVLLRAVVGGIYAVPSLIFGLAIFRSLGVFGRHASALFVRTAQSKPLAPLGRL